MASDLACDNRKMESASNVLPFMSLCANRYWKSERGCWLPSPVYSRHCGDEWSQNQTLVEGIMRRSAIHLYLIIFDWVSSCLFHSLVVQLSAHKKASSENCVRAQRCISAISTNGIFSQAPILSTSGAERRRWEHYQMCLSSSHQLDPGGRCRYRVTFSAWLPDINAISPPYYHGNISQSIRLNKWLFFFLSLASISLLPPSPSFPPRFLSCPAPLVFPAPEPITRPPQGPGLHNRVSSRPSYSSRIA